MRQSLVFATVGVVVFVTLTLLLTWLWIAIPNAEVYRLGAAMCAIISVTLLFLVRKSGRLKRAPRSTSREPVPGTQKRENESTNIYKILERKLSTGDERQKKEAREALSKAGNELALTILSGAVTGDHGDLFKDQETIQAIARIENLSPVPHLERLFRKTPGLVINELTRFQILRSRSEEVKDALQRIFQSILRSDDQSRFHVWLPDCVRALDTLQWRPAELKASVIFVLALEAYEELERMGEKAIPFLLETLRKLEMEPWKNVEKRKNIITTLGRIGSPMAVKPLLSIMDPAYYAKCLHDAFLSILKSSASRIDIEELTRLSSIKMDEKIEIANHNCSNNERYFISREYDCDDLRVLAKAELVNRGQP